METLKNLRYCPDLGIYLMASIWMEILAKIILHSHLESWRAVVSHTADHGQATGKLYHLRLLNNTYKVSSLFYNTNS
jgi:hypothetical protein